MTFSPLITCIRGGANALVCLCLLSLMLLPTPVAAWPWPPNPNYPNLPPPIDGVQMARTQALMREIRLRQLPLLARMQQQANASQVSSFALLTLDEGDFPALLDRPALNQAWQQGADSSSARIDLQFGEVELLRPSESAPALASDAEAIARYQQQLADWSSELRRLRGQLDESTFRNLNNFYQYLDDWLQGRWINEDAQRSWLLVASHNNGGGSEQIAGMALTSLERGQEGHLEFVVASPASQLERSARPEGTISGIGQPLMDRSYRQLADVEGVDRISVDALNNRVSQFARARGFTQSCVF